MLQESSGQVKLIDFDWRGKDGQDTYSVNMNPAANCGWHMGVKRCAVMKKSHNDYLFDQLPVQSENMARDEQMNEVN